MSENKINAPDLALLIKWDGGLPITLKDRKSKATWIKDKYKCSGFVARNVVYLLSRDYRYAKQSI